MGWYENCRNSEYTDEFRYRLPSRKQVSMAQRAPPPGTRRRVQASADTRPRPNPTGSDHASRSLSLT